MTRTRWESEDVSHPALIWAVGAAYFAMMPHLPRLPLWIIGLVLLTPLWRWAAVRGTLPLPNRWLLALLTITVAILIVTANDLTIGRVSGVQLLAVMTGLKVLETRHVRDTVLLVFLGYLLVITRFFHAQGLFEGVYLLISVFTLTCALLAINRPARTPGVGELLRPASVLIVQALPGMVILFLLVPRLSGPLWSTAAPGTGVTGISDRMSPGSVSQLTESGAVAFRVRFHGDPPSLAELYWRGPVLWHYDGISWTRRDSTATALLSAGARTRPGALVQYEVTAEPSRQPWMFTLELPITVPDSGRLTDSMELIRRAGPIVRELRYALVSRLSGADRRPLSRASRTLALQLPRGTGPRTRALARDWVAQGLDPAQRVARALTLFRDQPFTYTLTPPLLDGDRTDAFLFETRRGFCEHFASSFVVLMRAAGVPARVVTGYQGGEFSPLGGYLLVRQADAHAWAEVWIEGRGWTRVDPTAAVSPERVERGLHAAIPNAGQLPLLARASGGWLHEAALYWDALYRGWDRWVLGFGPENQRRLMAGFGLDWVAWHEVALTLVVALGLWMLGLWMLWVMFRKVPRQDPITRAYGRFCQRTARAGVSRRRHEGPLDFARRIVADRPDLDRQVDAITRVYTALAYGSRGAPDARLVRRLQDLVARFRP